MVLSDDSSGETWMMISTLSAVLSSTLRILILPFSLALMIDSLIDSVVGDFGDGERAFVDLRDPRAHLHRAAAQSVVVAAHVGQAARRKVGIELEIASLEMGDRRGYQLIEVVRQDLRRQAHGDAVRALRQQQRELDGQRHRLLLAAVVGEHPLGGLAVEDHVEGELRQPRLDVSARGGLVAREDVAPVALAVDQQLLLSELHECILDRGVAVRVVLHGLTHDVGHLVVAAVVDDLHGVEDAPLHGLQAVLDVRHGALQDHVGGVIQKPVLVHARELAHVALVVRQAVEPAPSPRFSGGLPLRRVHRRVVRRIVRHIGRRGILVERVILLLLFLFRHIVCFLLFLSVNRCAGPAPRGPPRCAGCR